MTTRRHYISGAGFVLVSGLAGCTGGDPGGTRPSGTGGPGVNIVSTDEGIDLPVRPAVAVVRDAATPDHPPRFRTTLTNTGDEPVTVGEARAIHFEFVTDDSGALVQLVPDTTTRFGTSRQ